MRPLAALLAFCAALFGQRPVLVENVTGATISDYLFCGMPERDIPAEASGTLVGGPYRWRWVREPHGVRIFAERLGPVQVQRLEFVKDETAAEPEEFALDEHLERYFLIFLPAFRLGGEPGEIGLDAVELQTPYTRVLHRRWYWAAQRVTVDLWCTFHHRHAAFEWSAQAVYGTTANDGQPQSASLPALTMVSAGPIQLDHWKRHGLPQYSDWNAEAQRFGRTFKAASSWHRARRYWLGGAVLVTDDQGMRQVGVRATALYTGWQGHWLALGEVPAKAPDAAAILLQRRSRYWPNQLVGSPRDRAQPPSSGTTGEQVEFGAANDLAVTMEAPWEIHDASYHVQAHGLRPTANKEPGGEPMQASRHPKAQTYNQRPDLLYGLEDRLGWPGANQIAWITDYTTSDDEHRADGLLHAYIALTRDPAAIAIVRDHIELDGTDVYRQLPGNPVGAARAAGRLLLANANQVWLGFEAARPWMLGRLERIIAGGGWHAHNGPIKTFAPAWNEAKYGWRCQKGTDGNPLLVNGKPVLASPNAPEATTLPIRGWQPWQEAILMRGLLAVHAVTQDQRALDTALMLAGTIVDSAFYQHDGGRWLYCYSLRWNNGQPFVLSSYDGGVNVDTYTDGATNYWSIPAAILLANRGNARALRIVTGWGAAKSMAEARWWALR